MTEFDNFFKSAFTVDNVIFGFDEGDLKVLLIKRGEAPYMGQWALPGYFVYPNEDLDTAANRVLEELTGLFSAFANEGMYSPLKYVREDTARQSATLISSFGSDSRS